MSQGSVDLNVKRASRWVSVFLIVTGLFLVVACGGGTIVAPVADQIITPSPTAALSPATEIASPLPVATRNLVAGEFHLPAANTFGEPGFHEVLTVMHDLPSDLGRRKPTTPTTMPSPIPEPTQWDRATLSIAYVCGPSGPSLADGWN